jgi:hypothetical protein
MHLDKSSLNKPPSLNNIIKPIKPIEGSSILLTEGVSFMNRFDLLQWNYDKKIKNLRLKNCDVLNTIKWYANSHRAHVEAKGS